MIAPFTSVALLSAGLLAWAFLSLALRPGQLVQSLASKWAPWNPSLFEANVSKARSLTSRSTRFTTAPMSKASPTLTLSWPTALMASVALWTRRIKLAFLKFAGFARKLSATRATLPPGTGLFRSGEPLSRNKEF